MLGALYTSVRLGEDWLRAALDLIIFAFSSTLGDARLFTHAGTESGAIFHE
jgi:hypothetical protein